ncbi:MAG: B12-binding domain-containing radical SAM protein [Candidatus Omnitrophica bacterium]|nr:B12-binding domain-containing radical SAM protein [Candidatus Omnitrophota bacterium]MCB9748030.1 B12-binding domain-containing radical SAM protein [Candidatus Omnitrophota bacterium]
MKKITFIYPAVGKKPGTKYIRTWKMEPLPIAALASLTPDDIETEFFDDRLELIDYETETDLVAITAETYTAMRAYDIADKFRKRGIKVVLGGYHPTHLPEESGKYADSVVIGNAESVWEQLLKDANNGGLKKVYKGVVGEFSGLPNRDIFKGKNYVKLGLVETGRGCPFKCEFCHITTYYNAKYYSRPIKDVVEDIKRSGKKLFFFCDDNFVANPKYTIELCKELVKLNIKFSGQGTITMAKNKELLYWLKKAGCVLLLIGFESMEDENLKRVNKDWMSEVGDRGELVDNIHRAGISIYATFIFGLDHDTQDTFKKAIDFAHEKGFYYTAFNHLLPFPETPLYRRLDKENRLINRHWWLDRNYKYGDIAYQPINMTPQQLTEGCLSARRKFFCYSSIFKRAIRLLKRNPSLSFLYVFLHSNLNLKDEVEGKYSLPLGSGLDELPK